MNKPQAMQELIRAFVRRLEQGPVHIAVVGDMILDNAIEGVPGGVHPDTKVPILRDASSQESIGGAANIALALSRLGATVSLFGLIGSDLPGRQLENLLDRQPFDSRLITVRGWPTPRKDWIYRRDRGQVQLVQRIDYDRPLEASAREELTGEFRARCPESVQVVILADHGLGCIGPESLPLIGLARERQAKVVAIPRSVVMRGQPLDALVLNAAEMRRLANADEAADAKALAAAYAREYGQHVFLSLFEEGIYLCPAGLKSGQGTPVAGYELENPDWMGVRDMTTAVVGLGLAMGTDVVELARVANVFRHLSASQRGNGRVLWRDVYRFVGLDHNADDPTIHTGRV